MTDKLRAAAEMALHTIERLMNGEPRSLRQGDQMKKILRQALAEPDTGIDRGAWADVPDATKWVDELRGDEPVAKVCHNLPQHIGWNPKITHLPDEGTPLYTAPQKREWQGLTDDEIAEAVGSPIDEVYLNDFRKVEAKLKEKNHAP